MEFNWIYCKYAGLMMQADMLKAEVNRRPDTFVSIKDKINRIDKDAEW